MNSLKQCRYHTYGAFYPCHAQEDYRPIYFYVAQPYTIPCPISQNSEKLSPNYYCDFGYKKYPRKNKQIDFPRSFNEVQFFENEGRAVTITENSHYLKKEETIKNLRMTSMFQRGTIFATFFLSLIGGGLICAALVTEHWIEAHPWRTPNPQESAGRIHFGLLRGKKELNVAYGWRSYSISVSQLIKQDPNIMSWNLWIGTLTTTSIALLAAAMAALLAVFNTATSPKSRILSTGGIYFMNILTLLLCITSAGTWLAQYFLKLSYNVLSKEDIDNMWTSEGSAELGYSFWLVVSAGIIHLISVALVIWGSSKSKNNQLEPIPPVEEKTAAAIMLY